MKSDTDSFRVSMLKMVNGASKPEAEDRASRMNFNLVQKDTALLFDRGIPITRDAKFRNQTVYVTVSVPVGKKILIRDNVGWGNDVHFEFGNRINDWDWRNDGEDGYRWDSNVEYIMTAKGLERTDAGTKKYDESEDNRNDGIKKENESAEPEKHEQPEESTRYR